MTTVTDKVKLEDDRVGVVKFVGEINKKEGVFYGIEISKGAGLNAGNVGSTIYFPCRRNKGVFVKENKIARSKPSADADVPRITYGTRVGVPDKGVGVVKYVGYPEFRQGPIFYGIELEEPNGKNDGNVNGKFYFRTAAGHGIFLPQAKISTCEILDGAPADDEDTKDADADAATEPAEDDGDATEEKEMTDEVPEAATDEPEPAPEVPDSKEQEPQDDSIVEGDGVMVDDDKRGLVRYVGENKETKKLGVGLWYGVRLVEARGNCDGTFKGHKFFKCPGGYGVMVQARRITRKLTEDEMDFDFSQDDEPTPAEIARHEALEAARQKKKTVKAFRAKFKEIDEDGNMTIEKDEFARLMAETTGAGPEESERLFYEIDVSRSEAISFAEFDAWFQKQQGTTNIGADDENKADEAMAAMSSALAEDIKEDVDEDVAEELAAEDEEQAEAEAEAEAAADAEAEAEPDAEAGDGGDDEAGDA